MVLGDLGEDWSKTLPVGMFVVVFYSLGRGLKYMHK